MAAANGTTSATEVNPTIGATANPRTHPDNACDRPIMVRLTPLQQTPIFSIQPQQSQ
ncbi:hypothetical protein GCM10009745_30720 [Kribbella yunnanensis]|uniref:Uncharacterized protein n=1 Tax=Kribbella yunnanensis TaxID=190194 RepID=A0ABN2H9I2_9ACTN